jgi:hypothetical protein
VHAEKTGSAKCIIYLLPVGSGIVAVNFQIAIVGFFYVLIESAHLSGIALFSTSAIFRTSYDWRKGNGLDFTHFPIALANCDFNGVDIFHNAFPFCIVLLLVVSCWLVSLIYIGIISYNCLVVKYFLEYF